MLSLSLLLAPLGTTGAGFPAPAVLQDPAPAPRAIAPPPTGGFTLAGSASFASQYLFRGLTQTDGRPTIQGGLDLVHAAGFYLGAGLSNISWYTDQNAGLASDPTSLGSPGRVGPPLYDPRKTNSASVEVDLFGGCKRTLARGWTIDFGLFRYLYPGTFDNQGAFRHPDTTEAYLGVARSWASLRYSRVISANTFGVANSGGTAYLDLTLNWPLGEGGWSLQAHAGTTRFRARPNPANFQNGPVLTGDNGFFSYSDFKLGLSRTVGQYTLAAFATHADTRARARDGEVTVYENARGRNIGGTRWAVSLSSPF